MAIIRKTFGVCFFLLAGLYCLVLHEGAGVARRMDALLTTAQRADYNEETVLRLVDRADRVASQSWARPANWHPGVLASSGQLESLRYAHHPERVYLEHGRDAAQRAVRLAPVQPGAWFRLADFAQAGLENPHCNAATCLENSWKTGPILRDEALMCSRLRLANALEVPFSVRQPELSRYAAATNKWKIRDCLAESAQQDLFFALMKREAYRTRRESE